MKLRLYLLDKQVHGLKAPVLALLVQPSFCDGRLGSIDESFVHNGTVGSIEMLAQQPMNDFLVTELSG